MIGLDEQIASPFIYADESKGQRYFPKKMEYTIWERIESTAFFDQSR